MEERGYRALFAISVSTPCAVSFVQSGDVLAIPHLCSCYKNQMDTSATWNRPSFSESHPYALPNQRSDIFRSRLRTALFAHTAMAAAPEQDTRDGSLPECAENSYHLEDEALKAIYDVPTPGGFFMDDEEEQHQANPPSPISIKSPSIMRAAISGGAGPLIRCVGIGNLRSRFVDPGHRGDQRSQDSPVDQQTECRNAPCFSRREG